MEPPLLPVHPELLLHQTSMAPAQELLLPWNLTSLDSPLLSFSSHTSSHNPPKNSKLRSQLIQPTSYFWSSSVLQKPDFQTRLVFHNFASRRSSNVGYWKGTILLLEPTSSKVEMICGLLDLGLGLCANSEILIFNRCKHVPVLLDVQSVLMLSLFSQTGTSPHSSVNQ